MPRQKQPLHSSKYFQRQLKIKLRQNFQKVFYHYELTSSFNSEKEINYFDNQRSKNKGNIEEGETITRNIDIENSKTQKC